MVLYVYMHIVLCIAVFLHIGVNKTMVCAAAYHQCIGYLYLKGCFVCMGESHGHITYTC